MLKILRLSLGLAILSQGFAQSSLPRVLMVTLSGVRPDDMALLCPSLDRFKAASIFYSNVVAKDYEFHMPAVMAINSGINYDDFYMGQSALKSPSIFQLFRKQYKLPANAVWSIGAWSAGIAQFADKDWDANTYPDQIVSFPAAKGFAQSIEFARKDLAAIFEKSDWDLAEAYSKLETKGWPHWDSYEDVQFAWFMTILSTHHPYIVHYVMNAPESAHFNTWAHYAISIKESCQKLETLLNFIDKDSFYHSMTYLVVSIDHSRDLYYMQHDEHSSTRPSRVWMFWFGVKGKKGIVVDREVTHKDIFATVKSLYQIPGNYGDGHILWEVIGK